MYYDANFIAILVASLGSMVLGGIWYSPKVFGKKYMSLVGSKSADCSSQEKKKGMLRGYIVMFFMGMVQAAVLYLLLIITRAGSFRDMMTLAFLVWAGFQLAGIVTDNTWKMNSHKLTIIDATYALFSTILTIILLTLFM